MDSRTGRRFSGYAKLSSREARKWFLVAMATALVASVGFFNESSLPMAIALGIVIGVRAISTD
jgi:hypothetical protein